MNSLFDATRFMSRRKSEKRMHYRTHMKAVSIAVASAIAIAGIVVPLQGDRALAVVPDSWPVIEIGFDPGYLTLAGFSTAVETPTVHTRVYDEVGSTAYPQYDFEIRIENSQSPPALIESQVVSASRLSTLDPDLASAEWAVPEGVLTSGQTYYVSSRLLADNQSGPWSPPSRLHVAIVLPTPTLLIPADGELLGASPTLEATVGMFDSAVGAEVEFRVESDWQNGAPVEVAAGTAVVDESGHAEFPLDVVAPGYEGHFRWQALVRSDDYSEWSDFSEFFVSDVPGAVFYPVVAQDRDALTVQWGSPQVRDFAPLLGFTVTLEPGNVVASLGPFADSATFENLPVGEYEISIRANNALGQGINTSVLRTLTSYAAGAPTNVSASTVFTDATITWEAPTDLGRGVLDHYEAYVYSYCPEAAIEASTTSPVLHLSGLTAGCDYVAVIYAVTEAGTGEAEAAFFTAYGLPTAPTNPEVRVGDKFVDVFWDPAYANGSPILSYRITTFPGGHEQIVTVGSNWNRQGSQVSGLVNGTTYYFEIETISAAGFSPILLTTSIAPLDDSVDQDQDGLVDGAETRVGTNLLLDDTDSDGLSDFQEITQFAGYLDPLVADSDGDSISDSDSDADADGVNNLAEATAGTDGVLADSDGDELSDQQELTAGTDALNPDTDDDGLDDGFESLRFTNALDPDSDSNGTVDGAEVITEVLSINQPLDTFTAVTPTSASVEGTASVVQNIVLEESSAEDIPGALTSAAVVDVFHSPLDDEGESARPGGASENLVNETPNPSSLTFGYSSFAADRLTSLAPVRWSESLGTWEFADNDVSVSTASQTISVESPTLGVRYAVVDLNEWRANATQCDTAILGEPRLDVEVLLDQTFSVTSNDSSGERFTAVRAVLDSLRPGDRVSIRTFGFSGGMGSRSSGSSPVVADYPTAEFYLAEWSGEQSYNPPSDAFLPDLTDVSTAKAYLQSVEDNPLAAMFDEAQASNDPLDAEYLLGHEAEDVLYGDSSSGPQCRLHTTVLVTDGDLKPPTVLDSEAIEELGEDYVPFRLRTDPVHVLDVGSANSASAAWLEDLADSTDGTYSYVPTATDLDGWIDDVIPYGYIPPVADTVDSDGDGLPNNVETAGVVTTMTIPGKGQPSRFTSNPHGDDTDGDGVLDGQEIGSRATAAELGVPVSAAGLGYFVLSNPNRIDSDLDGALDLDELELGINALNADPDSDGVEDGTELAVGSMPMMSDTDSDGHSDGFEIDNSADGFDPLLFDEPLSPNKWVEDVAQGYLCGEYCFNDSIGWLIGNLVSGYLVLGDVRDLVFSATNSHPISGIVTAIGLVPLLGDVTKSADSIVRFIGKTASPGNAKEATRIAANLVGNDTASFLRVIDAGFPTLVTALRSKGVSDRSILDLVQTLGGDHLMKLIDSPMIRTTQNVSGMAATYIQGISIRKMGENGEAYASAALGILQTNKSRTAAPPSYRYYDLRFLEESGATHFYEVKVGTPNSMAGTQLKRDIAMNLDPEGNLITWIFLASSMTGKIGPAPALLRAMEEASVPFQIHWPA